MTSISELNCPVCNSGKLDLETHTEDPNQTLVCLDCQHTFLKEYGVVSSKAYFEVQGDQCEG